MLIVGVARNCANTIPRTISALKKFVGEEEILGWHVVESDSEDKTVEVLAGLAKRESEFTYVTLGKLSNLIPSRISRIAHCRELTLQWVQARAGLATHVLVVDFDGVARTIDSLGLSSVLKKYPAADAIFANCRGRYYDLLALRAAGWMEEDYRVSESRMISQGKSVFQAKYESLVSHFIKLHPASGATECNSAFGGLAIYRASSLRNGSYLDENSMECEHVIFHRSIQGQAPQMLIAHDLRVTGAKSHSFWNSIFLRPFWLVLVRLGPRATKFVNKFLSMKAGSID